MSRYLLVSRSVDFETRLQALLGSRLTAVESSHLAEGPQAVFARAPRRPGVALLGPLLNFEETKALSDGLIERFPEIGIVIVRDGRADMEDWVDGMAIHAVLPPDADDATVERVLESLDERAEGMEEDDGANGPTPGMERDATLPVDLEAEATSRVIAIVAPKGGQGKTTVAINLAAGLAEAAPNSVVLVDADLQFGDVAHTLDLPQHRTLDELIGRDDVSIKTTLIHHAGGFFVVPAPRSPEDADLIESAGLGALLQQLARIFRYVVVDTTPGLGEHALAVFENATDAIFVSSLAVPSLRALHSELRTLSTIGLMPRDHRLVLNFVDRSGGLRVKDAERISGQTVDVAIPRSSAVLLSVNRGVPLIHHDPRDRAARALRDVIARFEPNAIPTRRRIPRRRA